MNLEKNTTYEGYYASATYNLNGKFTLKILDNSTANMTINGNTYALNMNYVCDSHIKFTSL